MGVRRPRLTHCTPASFTFVACALFRSPNTMYHAFKREYHSIEDTVGSESAFEVRTQVSEFDASKLKASITVIYQKRGHGKFTWTGPVCSCPGPPPPNCRGTGPLTRLLPDGSHWPGQKSFLYMGLLPDLSRLLDSPRVSQLSNQLRDRLLLKLSQEIHTECVLCTGRIWGAVRKANASGPRNRSYTNLKPQKIIQLPSYLSHLQSSSPRLTNSFS